MYLIVLIMEIMFKLENNGLALAGWLGWSVAPICQGRGFDPQSGPIQGTASNA